MARKNEANVEATDATDENTPNERRRQSPLTRLKFALNNIIGVAEDNGLSELGEVVAGKNLLLDLEFDLRPSTVITASKITQAMMTLDPMNDLTPRRIKKLGQLLAKAQRGDLITEEDIEEATGGEVEFTDDDGTDSDEATTDAAPVADAAPEAEVAAE